MTGYVFLLPWSQECEHPLVRYWTQVELIGRESTSKVVRETLARSFRYSCQGPGKPVIPIRLLEQKRSGPISWRWKCGRAIPPACTRRTC